MISAALGCKTAGRLLAAILPFLTLVAIVPAPARAANPVVKISADTTAHSTRVLLTHSRRVTRIVLAQPGKIDVIYAEPVTVNPPEQRVDGDLVVGWKQASDRRLELETGPDYERYETFELRNPDRLIVDFHGVEGDGGVVYTVPGKRGRSQDTVIVIDPGHGGSELGAVGPTGLREKEVALDLARRLKQLLQQDRSVNVVLTRDEDRHMDFDDRTAVANHNQADLFISIHLNSSPRKSARGAETYYLSTEATDDEARTLAALENRSFGADDPGGTAGAGDSLDLVLWDLAQNRHLSQSSALAESVQSHLNRLTGTRNRGVRQAPFRVLMGATMPAILVEVGFISNREEEERFRGLSYRNRVVEAIANAVDEFLQSNTLLTAPAPSGSAGSSPQ